ncbi:Uncharacterised protein [Vibrio cholerae]|nr:Uncharacterised protein [Vibrio cholerae]
MTTRKLLWITMCQMAKLYDFKQLLHALLNFRRIWTLSTLHHLQAKRYVIGHRHMTKQRIVLEHKADSTIAHMHIRYVTISKMNRTGIRPFQPRNNTQQSGFS